MRLVTELGEGLFHLTIEGGGVTHIDPDLGDLVSDFRHCVGSLAVAGCEDIDTLNL